MLIELVEARGNHVLCEEERSPTVATSVSEVISQRLVSFRSVEELQKQNQRLLVVLRDLADAQEKEETRYVEKFSQILSVFTRRNVTVIAFMTHYIQIQIFDSKMRKLNTTHPACQDD